MLYARDIMNKDVVTVTLDTTIEELGKIFIDKRISGAPVVDAHGALAGIVTENDLISQNKRLHIPTVIRLFDAFIPIGTSEGVEKEIRRMSATKVSEICTRDVITVSPDTPLDEIATIMAEEKVHLLPVLSGDGIVGIIGKIDIIRSMFSETGES